MPTYSKADDDTIDLVRKIMEKYHHDLAAEDVTVDVLWAYADGGEPLKLRGYPAAAIIGITSLKDRVLGVADAVIRIDGTHWNGLNGMCRTALIDHELTHLELCRDPESNEPLRDDHNRPRLKSRPHDWEIGGFDEIVQRHGKYAPEKMSLESALARLSQGTFAFEGEEDAPEGNEAA
jgi:hypothetical protein